MRTQRHSILVETPSSTSSDGDFTSSKMETEGRKRPKVKVRRKCLRTQSTSELPQLNNGGLTKGLRRVHSSSSFYRMTALEEPDRYAQVGWNKCKWNHELILELFPSSYFLIYFSSSL